MSAAQQMPARCRRRLWLAAAWTLVLAALAVLLVLGLAGRGAGTSRPAPALPRQALVGRPPTLAELLGAPHARHAALVVFWASWCEPCQQEAPAVERFARSVAGRGRIAGVDYAESEAAVPRAFVRRYSWTFPTLRDTDGQAGEAYDLGHLPSTYAIDARGRIVDVLVGPQTARSLTRALATAQGS